MHEVTIVGHLHLIPNTGYDSTQSCWHLYVTSFNLELPEAADHSGKVLGHSERWPLDMGL